MRRFTLFAATLLTAAIPLLAAWLGRVPESVRLAGVDSCLHLVLPAPVGPIGWPRTCAEAVQGIRLLASGTEFVPWAYFRGERALGTIEP